MNKDIHLLLPFRNYPWKDYLQPLFTHISFYENQSLKDLVLGSSLDRFLFLPLSEKIFDVDYFLFHAKDSYAVSVSYSVNNGGPLAFLNSEYSIISYEKQSSFIHDGYVPTGAVFFTKDHLDRFLKKDILMARGIPTPLVKKDFFTPALFLDRDGVINVDDGKVYSYSHLEIYEDIIPLIRRANEKKWKVVVLSNQAAVGRGLCSVEDIEKQQDFLQKELSLRNAFIDDFFFCPFCEDGKDKKKSLLRKPEPGMLLLAAEKYAIDLKRGFMIGDKVSDEIKIPGLKGCLIKRNYDLKSARWPVFSDYSSMMTMFR